ncbi:unnamed protein product [Lactuca saligna]|uniref:Uncharacterized protein n=1 Tax=Lactuca saligna TaxID=75948 RepID=A0AA35YM82_LACSI|nr:unnamed protein product [Lactuca saligna]
MASAILSSRNERNSGDFMKMFIGKIRSKCGLLVRLERCLSVRRLIPYRRTHMDTVLDLERVRNLKHWICSTPIPKTHYQPPSLGLPPAPEVDLTVKERPKNAVGQKRAKPSSSARDTKKHCGARMKNNTQRSKLVMKKCGQILGKLMKHKHGWVFNTPVDAAALKLSDYHKIINKPMDLGTIKSKLTKNEYESPLAFASDVRLTFQNAMLYNGKGSEVFAMAELLLSLFDEMFDPNHHSKSQNRSTKLPIEQKPLPIENEKPVSNVRKSNPVPPQLPLHPGNTSSDNIRKPKKPEMTEQEKSELAAGLNNLQLDPEGMDQIMAIVKKRVSKLEQDGGEIELDFGLLDDDTLWELHRFVGISCKKTITNMGSSVQTNNSPDIEEEIDIGEEIPLSSFPFLEIEKDGLTVSSGGGGSSSSSTSDSSSSDSDGCSG